MGSGCLYFPKQFLLPILGSFEEKSRSILRKFPPWGGFNTWLVGWQASKSVLATALLRHPQWWLLGRQASLCWLLHYWCTLSDEYFKLIKIRDLQFKWNFKKFNLWISNQFIFRKCILATGDGQGYIRVFRLGETLTAMSGRDIEVLEEIMNTGIDWFLTLKSFSL